jgi:DNA-directed RNA polymerase subunit RPC12/RpoP
VNAFDIILVVAGVGGLILVITAAGLACERRIARKLASSLLGKACPYCGSPVREDAIRSARLEHGFEDQDVAVICSNCGSKVVQYEKDRPS